MVSKKVNKTTIDGAIRENDNCVKQTEIRKFPEEWEVKNLGSLGNFMNGINKDKEDFGFGVPFVNLQDVFGVNQISKKPLGLVNAKDEEISRYSLKAGDVLFVRSSVKPSGVGLTAVITEDLEDIVFSGFLIRFRQSQPELITDFMKFCFYEPKFRRKLLSCSSISANTNINQKSLEQLVIAVPPKNEQKKIAEILGSVEEAIASTQAVIDQTRKVKQGLLQQLLTKGIGHTKFKESAIGKIPESWEVAELGNKLNSIDAGWSPNCPDYPPEVGAWGVLKVSAITRGVFLEEESKMLPPDLEPRPSIQVHQGDILIARANGVAELVGQAVQVRQEPRRKLILSDKTLRLVPNSRCLNSEFLTHILGSKIIREQIAKLWAGSSGQKNISQAQIRKLIIPVPSITEQHKIVELLESFILMYEQNKAELISLGKIKYGLMQDLLTGKVRVKQTQLT